MVESRGLRRRMKMRTPTAGNVRPQAHGYVLLLLAPVFAAIFAPVLPAFLTSVMVAVHAPVMAALVSAHAVVVTALMPVHAPVMPSVMAAIHSARLALGLSAQDGLAGGVGAGHRAWRILPDATEAIGAGRYRQQTQCGYGAQNGKASGKG